MRAVSLAAVFGCALLSAAGAVDTNEYRTVIHPGAADGSGFWNRRAQWFMYAPAFAFGRVDGAVKYRFRVLDDLHRVHAFEADAPTAALAPVWSDRACRVYADWINCMIASARALSELADY